MLLPASIGWVPTATARGPEYKLAPGWQPPPPGGARVGVGADTSYDPAEEQRLREQARWDPGARLGQVGQHLQRNPLTGALEALNLPFEALHSGVAYAGGVLQGAEQAAGEAIGGRPLNRQERMVDQSSAGGSPQMIPRVQNILDPAEASARYNAIMNPIAQFGTDLLTPLAAGRALGLAGKASQATGAAGAAARALPALRGWNELQTLDLTPKLQAAGKIGAALTNPTVRAVGRVAPAVALGAAAATEDTGQERSLPERALAGAFGGATGLMLGHFFTSGLKIAGRSLGATFSEETGQTMKNLAEKAVGRPLTAAEDALYEHTAQARRIADQGESGKPSVYPGGWAHWAYDEFRKEYTDRFANIETLNHYENTHGFVDPANDANQGYVLTRLVYGVPKAAEVYKKQARDIVQEAGLHLQDTSQVHAYDTLRFLSYAKERAQAVMQTGPDAAFTPEESAFFAQLWEGAKGFTPQLRQQYKAYLDNHKAATLLSRIEPLLQTHTKLIDSTFGGDGTAAKWLAADQRITQDIHNPILAELEAAGLKEPGYAAASAAAHQSWGMLRAVGYTDPHAEPKGGPRFVAADTNLDQWHSDAQLTDLSLDHDMAHVERMLGLIQRNKVGQAFDNWRQADPQGFGKIMVPVGESGRVLPGETQIPVYKAGKAEQFSVPRWFGDTMLGLTDREADVVTGFMAKIVQPFRMGITTVSLPFIIGNVPRDFQTALQNSSMPWNFLKNYHQAWYELLSGGTDNWFNQHRATPWVQGLQDNIWKSLDHFVLRDLGRQEENFYRSGAGGSTQTETYRRANQAAGAHFPDVPGIGWVVNKGVGLLEAASEVSETATRYAEFRGQLKGGASTQQAAYAARNVTVDFSKGGQIMKLANLWMPLLNAREQGELRSAKAAADDPTGYALRLATTVSLPVIATYAWNRGGFSDLYDQIPQATKDRYFVMVTGSYTDALGRARPSYLQIPKDEMSQMVAAPLEHFLDAHYHTLSGGQVLQGDQRTERPADDMWLDRLGSLVPFNLNNDQVLNPLQWGVAALMMSPIAGTLTQMWANRDQFYNRQIVPDSQLGLPPQYRYNQTTSPTSKFVSHVMAEAGLDPESGLAQAATPSMIDFAINHVFGSAGMGAWEGSGDLVSGALLKVGLMPADAFKPVSDADLRLPDGAPPAVRAQYAQSLALTDMRPWWMRFIPRLFGGAGGEQTVTEKVLASGTPQQQKIWTETQAALQQYQLTRDRLTTEKAKLAENPDLTHAEIIARQAKYDNEIKGALQEAITAHPTALLDPQQRQDFIRNLPGVPIDRFMQTLPNLPAGTDVAALAARAANPPGVADPTKLSPQQLSAARNAEISKMSEELGVAPAVVRDYIGAFVMHRDVPALPVPALYLEQAVHDYLTPPQLAQRGVVADEVPPDVLGAWRRQSVTAMAQKWNLPEQDLLERIQTRLSSPEFQTPIEQSKERALGLAARVRELPQYVDHSGAAVGTAAEWAQWDVELGRYTTKPRAQWPAHIQQLDDAKRNAKVAKDYTLWNDPGYADYTAFYGNGRSYTPQAWADFQTGVVPKYKRGTPQQWLQWDAMVKLYNDLPVNSPQRARLRPQVRNITSMVNHDWQKQLELDEFSQKQVEFGQFYSALQAEDASA